MIVAKNEGSQLGRDKEQLQSSMFDRRYFEKSLIVEYLYLARALRWKDELLVGRIFPFIVCLNLSIVLFYVDSIRVCS